MKPEDMLESHPLYDDYWMLRFLQDTPGLGYGIYRLCDVAETALRSELKGDVFDINQAVMEPRSICSSFREFMEDGWWNYTKIIKALRQRCNSTIAMMELTHDN